jgi:hypothetical protein
MRGGASELRAGTSVDDIISQDRPPSRGWRRRAALAVAVAAVATLIVVEHAGHGGLAGHHARTIHRHGSARPAGSVVIAGPVQPWAAAARMPRNGVQPTWFSFASGALRPIGGLPRSGLDYVFTKIEGGWLLQPGPGRPATCGDCSGPTSSTQAGCGSCPRPPAAVYYLADRARVVTTIGLATMVAPGTAPGSAWLTTFPASAGLGTVAGLARQYDRLGRPRGPAVSLPVGYKIVQGTRAGLLLTAVTGPAHSGTDRLWNPAVRKVIRTFPHVIAASASQVAIAGRCGATCALRVLSLVTSRSVILSPPLGDPVAGSFSPDGRYLALEVRSAADPGPGTQIDVVALATGEVTAVPSTRSSGPGLDGFGWPGTGDYLAATLSSEASVQVTYWDAANSTIAVAYVPASLHPDDLVAGENLRRAAPLH